MQDSLHSEETNLILKHKEYFKLNSLGDEKNTSDMCVYIYIFSSGKE